jgi:hypothetical protein
VQRHTVNPELVAPGYQYILNQIGVKAEWGYKPDWVGTNHCLIFVKDKPE